MCDACNLTAPRIIMQKISIAVEPSYLRGRKLVHKGHILKYFVQSSVVVKVKVTS